MFKAVTMNRITGSARTFDVSIVDDGYIRTYGGMIALGRKCGNKRRDELSVGIEDVKAIINAHDAALSERSGEDDPHVIDN